MIRYAMIGFGGIAENRLAKEGFGLDRERFTPPQEAVLKGVTDIDPARRQAAESYGLHWYKDVDAVLADPEIEAVVIATNNATHAPLARLALQHDLHALVEKPIATRSEDAAELRELASSNNLSLAVDHMMTENRFNVLAREEVAAETIGTVNDAVLHMEFLFGSTPEEASSWRCSDYAELGGPIGDVASHCLYMAEFLLRDKIAALACVYLPGDLDIAVENGAAVRFRLAGGMTGSIRVSFSESRGEMAETLANLGYEIYGSGGVLRGYATLFQLSGLPGEPVTLRLERERGGHREDLPVEQPVNIYQQVIRRHARSIQEGRPMNGEDGMRNLQMIETCHASARQEGRWIQLSSDGTPEH